MIDDQGMVIIHSWVEIMRGCEITYELVNGSGASFTVKGKSEPFEMYFDTETLRAFVERGTAALVDLDTRANTGAGAGAAAPPHSQKQA